MCIFILCSVVGANPCIRPRCHLPSVIDNWRLIM